MAWYNNDWLYRKKITVDKTKVGETNTFVILVNLASDAQLSANAQADGDDILFTSSDGTTKLDHEIENYTTATGALIAWVEASISVSVDTDIYMYYGNVGASNQQNVTGTWGTNYKAVYHLKDDPDTSTVQDSTSNNNDGTKVGVGNPAEIAVQIGNGQDFNGSTSKITNSAYTGIPTGAGARTIECWVEADVINVNNMIVVHWGDTETNSPAGDGHQYSILFNLNGDGKIWMWGFYADCNSTQTIVAGTKYHLIYTYDGSNWVWYVGGSSLASGTITLATGTVDDIWIGKDYSGFNLGFFNGKIDELRISNIERTSGYVTSCWNNQNSPSTFYSLDTQEEAPVSGGGTSLGLIGVGG